MSKIDDGGQAFPQSGLRTEEGVLYAPMLGMTLRDWFAGQALVGCLAHYGATKLDLHLLAMDVYAIADAMLAERNKERAS